MDGWIKLHREWLDHWLYNENRPKTRREAWEDMLLLVNHSENEVLIGNEVFICKRGQSIRSIDTWAKQFNWSYSRVHRFFKLLAKEKLIVKEDIKKSTRITICKYDEYQGERRVNEEQMKTKQKTRENQIEINKNKKIENNGKRYLIHSKKIINSITNNDPYVPET
ncbi:MAG: hypothetical protein RBT74_08485 [Tenuifilaceae bacterium]|nr:hypothetical protein [Tenuifilaceae bacterium]